jgi:hypothetical protein
MLSYLFLSPMAIVLGGACPASKNCTNNKDVFLAINIPVLFLSPIAIVLGRGLLFLLLFDNIYQAIIALK